MRLQDNRRGGFYGVIFWHRSRLECIYIYIYIYVHASGEDRRQDMVAGQRRRQRGRKGVLFNDLRNCCPAIFCN